VIFRLNVWSRFWLARKVDKDHVFEDKGVKIPSDRKSLLYLAGTHLRIHRWLEWQRGFSIVINANRPVDCGERHFISLIPILKDLQEDTQKASFFMAFSRKVLFINGFTRRHKGCAEGSRRVFDLNANSQKLEIAFILNFPLSDIFNYIYLLPFTFKLHYIFRCLTYRFDNHLITFLSGTYSSSDLSVWPVFSYPVKNETDVNHFKFKGFPLILKPFNLYRLTHVKLNNQIHGRSNSRKLTQMTYILALGW